MTAITLHRRHPRFAYVIFYRILVTAGSVNVMRVTFMVPAGEVLLGTIFPRRAAGLNQIAA